MMLINGKRINWSFKKMISSWAELLGSAMLILSFASYIEVIATHQLSWWNLFNVFLIGG